MGSPPPDENLPAGDQRGSSRIRHAVPVQFSWNGIQGSGMLHDLSTRGARIEATSMRPMPETAVVLTIELRPGLLAVRLVGNVVRHTEAGFALEFFLDPDPSIEALLRWILTDSWSLEEAANG